VLVLVMRGITYAVDMASGNMIYAYIRNLMTIGSRIRVILEVLPQQFERL
jgi:hypothetical protein